MGETNHDAIFARVQKLFERMHQNQKLQKLAKENGMDVKNNAELTDDTINNLAVSIIALSLAKDANDPRYGKLVNTGLQKRSLKIEIINDYKDEANRLIGEYNNGNFQEMTKGCDVDSADVYINEAVDTSLSKPVFVVLEGSNDPISLAIKMYTKSRFSHVMLAFDLELNDLYGFDTSFRRDPETGNRHGFHRETFRSTYSNKDITVYAAYVSNDSYSKMKEYVESFKNTKKSGKYDWSIILNCLLNIDKKYTKSEYTQVCSTFVDAIFKQINVNLTGKQIPSPKDLGIAISDRKPEFKLLYDGIGSDYNPKSLKSKLRSFTKTKYSKQLDATENFQD